MAENNKNRESRLIGKDMLSLLKKYVPLLLLSVISVNSFSQANNTKTARQEIQIATESGSDKKSLDDISKDYSLKDYPNRESIDLNCIVGDYWSSKPAVYTSAKNETEEDLSDSQFAFYKFYNDSTFDSQWGDWRKSSQKKGFNGKYELYDEHKIIYFNIKNAFNQSIYEDDVQNPIPTGVKILEINDSTVTFIPRKLKADTEEKTTTMYRHPGCIADQEWEWQDEYGNQYSLLFTDNGFFEYWTNRPDKNIEIGELFLQGQYHLHNKMLYLEIIMATGTYREKSREKIVRKMDPVKRTYVRVNIEKRLINSSDIDALHKADVASRDWTYENCQYETEYPITKREDEKWMEITKMKIEEK